LRKVTDDMNLINRKDREGIVSSGKNKAHTSAPSAAKDGPIKLELLMGRKYPSYTLFDLHTKRLYFNILSTWMIQGAAPTISIENTSGFQLYLSKDLIESFITTAKSSEANVMVCAEDLDADMIRSLENRTKASKYANKFAWNSNAHLVVDGMYRV
nr:hypothetical protein [Tanacetum cinerariifolium]